MPLTDAVSGGRLSPGENPGLPGDGGGGRDRRRRFALVPDRVRAALAREVRRHLTGPGPATEALDSPHYGPGGYWRGPIWAPSTVLIEDGLRRAGHAELADEVSRRFRALCETSGFAENFDARTGAGQRDRAYTWTASSYLILAEAAIRRESAGAHTRNYHPERPVAPVEGGPR